MASINLLVCCRFFFAGIYLVDLLVFVYKKNPLPQLQFRFWFAIRPIVCLHNIFNLFLVLLHLAHLFFTSALNSIVVSMIILSRLCYIFVVVVVFLPLFFVLILCSIHRQRYVLWYCFFFCSPFDLQFGLLTGRLNQSSIIKFTY